MKKKTLFEKIITVEEANTLRDFLEKVATRIYLQKGDILTLIKKETPFGVGLDIISYLHQNEVDVKDPTKLELALDNLNKHLEELPCLTLTLSFMPKKDLLEKISQICDEHTSGHTVLALVVDEDILAGAIFEYNGKRRDYSLLEDLALKYGTF